MQAEDILDVTIIDPNLKHQVIFNTFDALVPGEHFVIFNDHDPKPLYHQLLSERGPVFSWKYIQEGPEKWQVQITKTKVEYKETIGDLVAKDFRKAEVFKKYGIDFCCGGKKTVEEACIEKNISPDDLEKDLRKLDMLENSKENDFLQWELSFLADYIVSKHHNYVKQSLPVLSAYIQRVIEVHGGKHPELAKIGTHFSSLSQELLEHTKKEEQILFPYIKQMEIALKFSIPLSEAKFGSVQNPIELMEEEHENAGNELESIRQLTDNYNPPQDACTTYRVMYEKFKEFEEDLHQHIHLENNILFPKAIKMESELQA